MEKKKILVTFFTFLFIIFGLSYERKLKSNKLKYSINNLQFGVNLDEKENEYNRKIDSVENKVQKKSYLLKNISSVNSENSKVNKRQPYLVYTKKNVPHFDEISDVKEDKKKKNTNSITNFFIQSRSSLSNDANFIDDYKKLNTSVTDHILRAKENYILGLSYVDVGSFYMIKEKKESHEKFRKNHEKTMWDFHKCSLKIVNFYINTKYDMINKLGYLLLVEKDVERYNSYKKELQNIKLKIEEDVKSTENDDINCTKTKDIVYDALGHSINEAYCDASTCNIEKCKNVCCPNKCCYELNCFYTRIFVSYAQIAKKKINKNRDNEFIQEVDNFLNSYESNEIKKSSFNKKSLKNYLDLLIEEVKGIKNDYEEQKKLAYQSYDKFLALEKGAPKMTFSKSNLVNDLAPASIEFKKTFHYADWNEILRDKFYDHKINFYIYFYGL
ncbi:reticulocyte binding protein, putative [Plasmodium gallinaceum]|uniref:Reticulocyte binding protein, putative n=1 Tax=Plasmodium gallinaceum TaxID=5849 RepID=A0A1J1GQB9_PLAGA|nr:reticulocyte binding protein, putative [Plasmodium gallinaceum]CRG94462.1 reticulocyte binding protein, putative [Plasmodium gallinaceum]